MMHKRLWILSVSSIVLAVATAGQAALSSPTNSHVGFVAAGPAGLKIEGTTQDLNVAEQSGNILITVPLGNLSTGIGLRDKHMKEKYLEVDKFPNAVLTVSRSSLKLPTGADKLVTDAPGTLQLHGQSRPVTVHYETKGDAGALITTGNVHINMNDYGIQVPTYLGVTVKPDVDVTASFRVAGN